MMDDYDDVMTGPSEYQCRTCGRPPSYSCRAHFTESIRRAEEVAADARNGQNELQARIDRALELLEENCRPGETPLRRSVVLHDDDLAAIRAALLGEGE